MKGLFCKLERKWQHIIPIAAAAGLAALFLVVATPAEAVHKGAGDLTCGACHTMHNSQGNASLGGNTDGSLVLLRGSVSGRQEIHNLCLQCHATSGAQGTSTFQPHGQKAPKVYIDGKAGDGYGYSGGPGKPGDVTKIGSAGDFSSVGTYVPGSWTLSDGSVALGKGHSLGETTVLPPGALEAALDVLSCTSCHDPHGTATQPTDATVQGVNKYRNLRVKPIGAGGGSDVEAVGVLVTSRSYVGGISNPAQGGLGTNFIGNVSNDNHIWPVYKDAANMNAYFAGSSANETGNAGISGWCAQCHDKWHENGSGTTNLVLGGAGQQDWRRHPVNMNFKSTRDASGAGVTKTDWTSYLLPAKVARLPLAHNTQPTATNGGQNATFWGDDSADRVFCFSCHFVHAGPFNDDLRWDYTSSVGTGSQSGNTIATGVGCQICHNR